MKKKIIVYWLLLCVFISALVLWQFTSLTPATAQKSEPMSPDEFKAYFESQQLPPEQLSPMAATPCVGGMAGIYPCDNVDLMAFMPLANIGGGNGNDIWGWTDPVSQKEYALMGRTNGTAFVDITDPVNPIYLGNLPTHTVNSSWRDIKVYNNYAFIVSEASNHGMQVFDLTRLRTVPTPPVTFTEDAHYNQFGNAHNIVINEDTGFAYAVGTGTCSGGLHMVNIQNPLLPTNAGCFSADGYTHDAQCVVYAGLDVTYQGQEICFNSNTDTLTIVNVQNKSNPVQISRTGYSGSGYTHQGWLTEDQHYFLLDDEQDEQNFGHNTRTRIWDVSDLDAPVLLGFFDSTAAAIDHNLYIKGNYTFEANYRAGLRILKNTNIASGTLSQEGYFDIYPSSDSASFNGAWSVYPYFDSGIVVVSGIEQGLFILKPTSLNPDFALEVTPNHQDVCIPSNTSFDVTVGQILGFSDPVTLSVNGIPAGYSGAFTTNPVTPPGTSTLNVTNTGAAVAGTYPLDVVGVVATRTHTVTVDLNLFPGIPVSSTLTAPADGAVGVSQEPTFDWTAVANTSNYLLEVATDSGFSTIVYSATTASNTHTILPADALAGATTYYWRVTTQNGCGTGAPSATFSFTTQSAAGSCPAGTTPNVLFETDLENGTPGWTHSGTGDTWVLSSARVTSGVNAWHATDSSTQSDQRLASPAITLPDLSQSPLTLQFWNYQAFEQPNTDGRCWDAGILEVTTNGTTWAKVPNSALLTDPYDAIIWNDQAGNNPITNDYGATDAWCPNPPPQDFLNSVVDLSAYAGQTVQFRWRLGTDSAAGNEGWYIDDIKVQACEVSGPAYGVDLSPNQDLTAYAGDTVLYTVAITNTSDVSDTFDLTVFSSNWTSLLSVDTITLEAHQTDTFEVTVDVPVGTSNGDNDTATVTAVSQGDGAVMDTSDLHTTVDMPVYGLDLSADSATTGWSGTTVTYTVWLTNTGDTTDTIDLSATAVWTTALSVSSLTLNPGETTSFWAWVDVPANAASGDNDVAIVTAVSQGNNAISDTVSLTTTATTIDYGVDLSAPMTMTAAANSIVTYTIQITNTGSQTDTFSVVITNTWATVVTPTAVTLAAGETGSLWVVVTVPTLLSGTMDTAVVTVTSQGNTAVHANTSLVTLLQTYAIYLPVGLKN